MAALLEEAAAPDGQDATNAYRPGLVAFTVVRWTPEAKGGTCFNALSPP